MTLTGHPPSWEHSQEQVLGATDGAAESPRDLSGAAPDLVVMRGYEQSPVK